MAPAEAAPSAMAWSAAEEFALSAEPHSWRLTVGIAVGVVMSVALLASAVGLTAWALRPAQPARVSGAASATQMLPPTAPVPSPSGPRAARPDDDEFVALALSPRALDTPRHAGFGTSGTQDDANRIALSECRADSGNDDCLLVNAGMFHGCVSYAISSSRRGWAGGSGVDVETARAAAVSKLGAAVFSSFVQCSDPPGIIRSGTPAAAPPPEPSAAEPGPGVDDAFVAALRRAQLTVPNEAAAVAAGRWVCEQLRAGHTRDSLLDEVSSANPNLHGPGATNFVAESVVYYCPQYEG